MFPYVITILKFDSPFLEVEVIRPHIIIGTPNLAIASMLSELVLAHQHTQSISIVVIGKAEPSEADILMEELVQKLEQSSMRYMEVRIDSKKVSLQDNYPQTKRFNNQHLHPQAKNPRPKRIWK